ncbi:hypothetical protein ABZW96_35670 [Nocardia sp. NPDC004168]|uniref:hypothetical protein n=1 Tax=Nocardia sp. NPDC004168 TaxID=3154452 RepID=UPI0033B37D21
MSPLAIVVYGRLLIEQPSFSGSWEELVAHVLALDWHPDHTPADAGAGLAQLRAHGHLVFCEDGWILKAGEDTGDDG